MNKIKDFENVGQLNYLFDQVLTLAFDRHRILQEAKQRFEDGFDYSEWQRRFVNWSKNKSEGTVLDIFKKMDENCSGILDREQFSTAINLAGFPTSNLEIKHVLNILDKLQRNEIDYYDFIVNLTVSENKVESQLIEDEVVRKVAGCKCKCRYHLEKVAKDQYKFGESQFLRLVRILRSTVMVRVGGGWVSLDEYLAKNDPCRGRHQTETHKVLIDSRPLSELISHNPTPNQGPFETMTLFTRKTGLIHSANSSQILTDSQKSNLSSSSIKSYKDRSFSPSHLTNLEKVSELAQEQHMPSCHLSSPRSLNSSFNDSNLVSPRKSSTPRSNIPTPRNYSNFSNLSNSVLQNSTPVKSKTMSHISRNSSKSGSSSQNTSASNLSSAVALGGKSESTSKIPRNLSSHSSSNLSREKPVSVPRSNSSVGSKIPRNLSNHSSSGSKIPKKS